MMQGVGRTAAKSALSRLAMRTSMKHAASASFFSRRMASSLPLGPADRASFEENGFLHVKGVLTKKDCVELV